MAKTRPNQQLQLHAWIPDPMVSLLLHISFPSFAFTGPESNLVDLCGHRSTSRIGIRALPGPRFSRRPRQGLAATPRARRWTFAPTAERRKAFAGGSGWGGEGQQQFRVWRTVVPWGDHDPLTGESDSKATPAAPHHHPPSWRHRTHFGSNILAAWSIWGRKARTKSFRFASPSSLHAPPSRSPVAAFGVRRRRRCRCARSRRRDGAGLGLTGARNSCEATPHSETEAPVIGLDPKEGFCLCQRGRCLGGLDQTGELGRPRNLLRCGDLWGWFNCQKTQSRASTPRTWNNKDGR